MRKVGNEMIPVREAKCIVGSSSVTQHHIFTWHLLIERKYGDPLPTSGVYLSRNEVLFFVNTIAAASGLSSAGAPGFLAR